MFTKALWPPIPIPLCDLRDLCAMLSPIRVSSRPEASRVHQRALATYPRSPSVTSVTSVRCFPRLACGSRPEASPFTKSILATYPNPPLWPP